MGSLDVSPDWKAFRNALEMVATKPRLIKTHILIFFSVLIRTFHKMTTGDSVKKRSMTIVKPE